MRQRERLQKVQSKGLGAAEVHGKLFGSERMACNVICPKARLAGGLCPAGTMGWGGGRGAPRSAGGNAGVQRRICCMSVQFKILQRMRRCRDASQTDFLRSAADSQPGFRKSRQRK